MRDSCPGGCEDERPLDPDDPVRVPIVTGSRVVRRDRDRKLGGSTRCRPGLTRRISVLVPPAEATRRSGPVPADGDVLVRLSAVDRSWPSRLPPVPGGRTLTVTLGHPRLLPLRDVELSAAGYRVVGTAPEHLPIGLVIDILVPRSLRLTEEHWWRALAGDADRVFDLRLGPVLQVLAAELELHLRAGDS